VKQHSLRDRLDVLQSLIDFAQMPEGELQTKASAIKSLLQKVLSPVGPAQLPWRSPLPIGDGGVFFRMTLSFPPWRSLARLRLRLLTMLKELAESTEADASKPIINRQQQLRDVDAKSYFSVVVEAVNDGGGLRLCATADDFDDQVLYTTFVLVEQLGRYRLRRCAAEGCGNVLADTGKKKFCSTRCSQRVYMRVYRDNDYMPPPKRGDRKGASRGKQTRARGR
jgi:CGNR zinc finger